MHLSEIDWRLPLKAYRDPTMRDVEEAAEKAGGKLLREFYNLERGRVRCYWFKLPNKEAVFLDEIAVGEKPDWRAMLQKLGVTWA